MADVLARWMTIEKAAELTGLPESFLHERTGLVGVWPEEEVWKWFEGRKLVDLNALYRLIDSKPSAPSRRGQRGAKAKAKQPQCPAPQPTLQV